MLRKFQIFVSSTYTDLVEERQDIIKAVLDLGHIPSGMEGFYAADEEQFSYIQRIIDECDYYVLVVAGRYGSISESGVSYTEREYDYAISKGLGVLAFLHGDLGSLPSGKVDKENSQVTKLNMFRQRVSERRLISQWINIAELKANVIISLTKAIATSPKSGWIRGDKGSSEEILLQLNDLRNKVDLLEAENSSLRSQMRPKVENIAPLDSEFTLRYFFYDPPHKKVNAEMSFTWSEIVKIVGPSLMSPAPVSIIDTCVKSRLREEYPERFLRNLCVYDSDVDVIKIQLSSYGIVDVSIQIVNNLTYERIVLTDFGKRTVHEIATVRA